MTIKYISLRKINSDIKVAEMCKMEGLNRDLNPGPPAPKAGIIPLDH